MTMREQFESWLSKKYGKHMVSTWDAHSKDYNQLGCTIAFEAWKASRETMVVELPPPYPEPEEPEFALDDSHMDAYHAAKGMRHACAKAIEAAGVKVTS